MKRFICCVTGMMLLLVSCKKDTVTAPSEEMTEMSVEFDNIMGGQNLFLNAVNYTNAAGESFNVSLLQYYISNIKLRKTDGTIYTVPQDSSYFLIKESEPDTRFARFKVPVGNYDQVSFLLGVDSTRSTMDISKRTGVLDPAGGMDDGMYWGWNSGNIYTVLTKRYGRMCSNAQSSSAVEYFHNIYHVMNIGSAPGTGLSYTRAGEVCSNGFDIIDSRCRIAAKSTDMIALFLLSARIGRCYR